MINIKDYNRVNSSYKKKFVFRFGDNAGFFSEFNNLVLAILYCLDNKYQFVLYTPPNGSLVVDTGWDDYFLPFCRQMSSSFQLKHNERFLTNKLSIYNKMIRGIYKKVKGISKFTYELWENIRSEDFINKNLLLYDLGIKGNCFSLTKDIIDMIWKYNSLFNENILMVKKKINLPSQYVGLHIRAGDKAIEAHVFQPDKYMERVKYNTEIKNIFVLTDDYRIIKDLQSSYPNYSFFTLCAPYEKGYKFDEFNKLEKNIQYREYAKLIASIDYLKNADIIIGTYSSNPGMFLGMCEPKKFKGIDSDKWLLKW